MFSSCRRAHRCCRKYNNNKSSPRLVHKILAITTIFIRFLSVQEISSRKKNYQWLNGVISYVSFVTSIRGGNVQIIEGRK